MATWVWLVLAVALVVIVGLAVMLAQQRKTTHLSQRFGPEYERAVTETGSPRAARAELQAREKRVEALNIRPLAPADQVRFSNTWRDVQAQFVDDPPGAVKDAD
jgi:hypothetical protein